MLMKLSQALWWPDPTCPISSTDAPLPSWIAQILSSGQFEAFKKGHDILVKLGFQRNSNKMHHLQEQIGEG